MISRATTNINDIKYDLLKIAEVHDGLLQEGLGELPVRLFNAYLGDMRNEGTIYSYNVDNIVLKEHSYTYDVSVQITRDRTPKKLKVHVGLYKSAWPDLATKLKYTNAGYVA
jgi:hypothetical protein